MTVTESREPLPLRGNDLALDLINTVADVRTGLGEHLPDPRSLLAWARHTGAVTAADARRIADSIDRDSKRAKVAYRRTLRLRRSLTRLVTGSAGGADLDMLNDIRRRASAARELAQEGDGYSLVWRHPIGLDAVTLRLAEAGVALVTSERLAYVRQCAGLRCGWLFLDRSRGRRRRWCAMEDCGNRAKVRRFREKRRSTAAKL